MVSVGTAISSLGCGVSPRSQHQRPGTAPLHSVHDPAYFGTLCPDGRRSPGAAGGALRPTSAWPPRPTGWGTGSSGCTCSRRRRSPGCCVGGVPADHRDRPGGHAGRRGRRAGGRCGPVGCRRDRVRAQPRPCRRAGRGLQAARAAAARLRHAGAVRRHHACRPGAAGGERAGHTAAGRLAAGAAPRGGARRAWPGRPGGGAGRRAERTGAARAIRPHADRGVTRGRARRCLHGRAGSPRASGCPRRC